MTNESTAIVGRIPGKSGRKPKTAEEVRVCADKACDTKLSRYNTKEACFLHRPPKFARVRGRPR